MKIVITGGAGFLGRRLADRLAAGGPIAGPAGAGEAIDDIVLFDLSAPAHPPAGLDPRIRFVAGDLAEHEQVFALVDRDDIGVFHLASVVSGGAEQDFDLAWRINLTGTLNLFEACRARAGRPRLVFASSVAVFGGDAMPRTVSDGTKQTPQSTYGASKAIGELLVNDYTRKGYFDGRAARLPTVIVRPGRPNAAASGFASGVFREPLNGEPCVLPVDTGLTMAVTGYRSAVDGLARLYGVDGAALGSDRAVNFPSLSLSVGEMIAGLRRAAGDRPLGEITVAPDPAIEAICRTWPEALAAERAAALGLCCEASIDDIVAAFIADYL